MSGEKILIIDDEAFNVEHLEHILRGEGFSDVVGVTRSTDAMNVFRRMRPDLVLLDLRMPEVDGFMILDAINLGAATDVPVVVLSADAAPESRRRALVCGAKDFVSKPFDAVEVVLRVRNLLEMRRLHRMLQDQNESLQDAVRERTAELCDNQLRMAEELCGPVIDRLFAVGYALQSAVRLVEDTEPRSRVLGAVDDLDAAIVRIRQAAFSIQQEGVVA